MLQLNLCLTFKTCLSYLRATPLVSTNLGFYGLSECFEVHQTRLHTRSYIHTYIYFHVHVDAQFKDIFGAEYVDFQFSTSHQCSIRVSVGVQSPTHQPLLISF